MRDAGYDDPDYEPPMRRPGRSGAVTAVAIVNFVFGGLTLLGGLVIMFMGPAILGAAAQQAQRQGDQKAAQQIAQAGGAAAEEVADSVISATSNPTNPMARSFGRGETPR